MHVRAVYGTIHAMGNLLRCTILFILVGSITACGMRGVVREPVVIERIVYVGVDAALTATSPIPEPRNDSGKELLRIARERKRDLQQCYADKRAIRDIQGSPKP